MQACSNMLDVLGPIKNHSNTIDDDIATKSVDVENNIVKDQVMRSQILNGVADFDAKSIAPSVKEGKVPKKKQSRSVLFGAFMGAIVACWVFFWKCPFHFIVYWDDNFRNAWILSYGHEGRWANNIVVKNSSQIKYHINIDEIINNDGGMSNQDSG